MASRQYPLLTFQAEFLDSEDSFIPGFQIESMTFEARLEGEGGGAIIPAYPGPYVITPSDTTQVYETSGKQMERDLRINPIPSNYGKITWNGAVLTVS